MISDVPPARSDSGGPQTALSGRRGFLPARLADTPHNWIGRSQNPADPYLSGAVDDFRTYQRALSRAELAELIDP